VRAWGLQAFEPYLRDVYAYLKSLLTLEGEENTSLRAYATDTLGSIIKNMGRTYFEADLQEIMKCVGWCTLLGKKSVILLSLYENICELQSTSEAQKLRSGLAP
jgi:hypothetical protein